MWLSALPFMLTPCSVLATLAQTGQDQKPIPALHQDADYETSDGPLDQSMSEFIERTMSDFHVPGLSISFSDAKHEYARGYGIAQMPGTKATAGTLYYTGSTTKSFTAASILLLIEQSANESSPIGLRTPISSLIREDFVLPDEYATIHATLEDALSHRTGMPRHDLSYGGPNFTVRDGVRNLRNLPMSLELRQGFQYCNMMFVVMSYVIEIVSGMWLGDFIRQHIWEPLEMSTTFFSLSGALEAERAGKVSLARGYWFNASSDDFLETEMMDAISTSGAGAIISNVVDYAKYLRAMMNEDPRILSKNSYQELRTPRTIADVGEQSPYTGPSTYSLGWEIATYKGLEVFAHDGATPGFGASMMYIPSKNWTLALMANTETYSNWAITIIALELLNRLLDVPADGRFDLAGKYRRAEREKKEQWKHARDRLYPDAPAPGKELPMALDLSSYAGTYFNPGYRNMTLRVADSPKNWLREPENVLHIDVLDKTWKMTFDFEHVTGEYFLTRSGTPDFAKGTEFGDQVAKAEFRIGSDSSPSELGIVLESLLGDRSIWFQKIA